MKTKSFLAGLIAGLLIALLTGLLIVPAIGIFNMSASAEPGLLDWWGHFAWKSSLRWRAPSAELPQEAQASRALDHYDSSCVKCHGAPEIGKEQWADLMQPKPPKPPKLWEDPTQRMKDGKLFRIIKHGVKMTAMPAFGGPLNDQEVWDMVAFVRHLNQLTPEERKVLSD